MGELKRTSKLIRLVAVVAVIAALFVFAAGAVAAQDATVTVTLSASEFKFDPNTLEVPEGTAITFNVTNSGQFPHNVTFESPSGEETNLFDANLPGGETRTGTFTFTQAGDWKMYCPVGNHEERGMVGTVKVVAAAAGASTPQPAASSDQTTAAQPGTLPRTGGGFGAVAALLLAGVAAAGAGIRLRRR